MPSERQMQQLISEPRVSSRVCQWIALVCLAMIMIGCGSLAFVELYAWSDRYVRLDHCAVTFNNVTHKCLAQCHYGTQIFGDLSCFEQDLGKYRYIDTEEEALVETSPSAVGMQALAILSVSCAVCMLGLLIFMVVVRAREAKLRSQESSRTVASTTLSGNPLINNFKYESPPTFGSEKTPLLTTRQQV